MPSRYAVLNAQGLLLAEGKTLAAALGQADSLDGHVYDRKTGSTQCQTCRRFGCTCRQQPTTRKGNR